MAKLTASQVAAKVGVTSYTIKRWYDSIGEMTTEALNNLLKEGMPVLPNFEVVGSMAWRYWNEEDVEQIIKFKEWINKNYPTKNGIFNKYKK